MENEYNEELDLRLGSSRRSSSTNLDSTRSTRMADWLENTTRHQQNYQQPITIFYNGKICVCDATEIQARAIICMARKGMGEKKLIEEKNDHQGNNVDLHSPEMSSESRPPSPPPVIDLGLSMKRSLQRFLQKRKTRMDDSSPYGRRPT